MSVTLEQERQEAGELAAITPRPAFAVWRRLLRNPLAVVSLLVLTLITLTALVYPLVSPYSYAHPTADISAPASARHWLGTDDSGYDLLTRLAVGARVSLAVGVGVEAIVLLVGVPVGLLAGYHGRAMNTALMRLTDMMFAFPDILLAILIMAVYGQSIVNLFVALAITGWPGLARLVRGQALALRGREFVEAARALGIPSGQILRRHLLPNLLSPIVVASTIDIAGVIIAEATLSFLGIGVPDPLPSWGKMISIARTSHYWRSHPALVIYPALCLSLTVLSLNFLGDALRDALDPRSEKALEHNSGDSMPSVNGVVETALYVDDLERSGRFYEEVFGFRQLMADDRMRAYSVADKQVLLLFKKGASTQPSPMHGSVIPSHDGQGNLHLAFTVSQSEIADWEKHLESKGIDVESRVHCGDDRPDGDSLYFRDPDGHLLELITPGCWAIY